MSERNERIKRYLKDDTKRPAFLSRSVFLFGLYYFPHFFTHKSADFHKSRCKDFESVKSVMLVAFRESAKTIWTMIYLCYIIVYKKRNFILFYSYEQTLASSRLFDLIVQLKTNKRIIKDFGFLFPNNATKDSDGLQKKSVSEFITSNHIKFKAMSINTSSRGLNYTNKYGSFRPDLVVFDDIDVTESVRNPEIVNKNIDFVNGEVFGGLDSQCKILFLGNIITNIGLVPYYMAKFKINPDWVVHFTPIKIDGKITRDRFVETDEEVEIYKAQGIKKISLEKKKREQEENYAPNFELVPNVKIGNPVFNHTLLHELVEPPYTVDERYKELKIYKPPTYDVVFGIDTASGSPTGDYATIVGRDSNNELVLTFQAKIDTDALAEVVFYIFDLGYIGKLIPESNNHGIALIKSLKENPLTKQFLYREEMLDKVTNKKTKKYGFTTTTKSKIIYITMIKKAIKDSVESEEVSNIEMDIRTKNECFTYYYDEKGSMNALSGSHDDMVIADALSIYGNSLLQSMMRG